MLGNLAALMNCCSLTKLMAVAREFFLLPGRLRFGLVPERSLLSSLRVEDSGSCLSSLDVVHSSSWSTVLYFAGCPSCSTVLREGDDLKSALQMQNSLVLEVQKTTPKVYLMEEPRRLTRKKKEEGVLVKCETSLEYLAYEKTFCLCIARDKEPHNPRAWYMLKISSEKDKEKEAEENVAKKVCQITDAELRGAYLAFHHNDRHQGELDRVPTLSPIVELKLGKSFRSYGTSSALVGSGILISPIPRRA